MSFVLIAYISAETLIGVITVTGNIVVLVSIISTKSLHTVTNVYIGNLAMADLAVGIVAAPCAILSFLGLPKDKYGCIFMNCVILSFTNISNLMLLVIAVERFVAIRFPFTYRQYATVKTAILINLPIWVVGSIAGSLPMFGWNIAPENISYCAFSKTISMEYMVYLQFFTITLIPLVIMFFIHLYIYSIVRKQYKQITVFDRNFQNQGHQSGRRWMKDVQVAKMFATRLLLLALFWLPINIMNTIKLFCPTCRRPLELVLATIVLSHANSSVNPFLYAANNTGIKIAIEHIFKSRGSLQIYSNSAFTSYPGRMSKRNQNVKTLSKEDSCRHDDEQRPHSLQIATHTMV